jgi:hypothetical protein
MVAACCLQHSTPFECQGRGRGSTGVYIYIYIYILHAYFSYIYMCVCCHSCPSINAIGPAPLRGGLKNINRSTMLICIANAPSLLQKHSNCLGHSSDRICSGYSGYIRKIDMQGTTSNVHNMHIYIIYIHFATFHHCTNLLYLPCSHLYFISLAYTTFPYTLCKYYVHATQYIRSPYSLCGQC